MGEEIPVPVDQKKLNIPITNDGWGATSYPYFEYRKEDNGINSDFSKVTILVSDQNELNGNESVAWSTENGQMITVPASSRLEAISLSNEIMEIFLKG